MRLTAHRCNRVGDGSPGPSTLEAISVLRHCGFWFKAIALWKVLFLFHTPIMQQNATVGNGTKVYVVGNIERRGGRVAECGGLLNYHLALEALLSISYVDNFPLIS